MTTTPIKAIEAYKAVISNTNNKEVVRGLFDKSLYHGHEVKKILHQELQKAREEEREILQNKFGDFAHEHYLGCTGNGDGTYTYGYDNEVIWLVQAFFENQSELDQPITNKDNK